MLTDQDIQKLKAVLATKKDLSNSQDKILQLVATKEELNELKEEVAGVKELVQALYISTDSLIKSIGELIAEYKAVKVQLSRHERWIKKIADKIGVELSFESV